MDNLSFLLGLNANAGGSGSTPSWSDIEGKPFNTIGTGLTVTAGALQATGEAAVDWDNVENKPFETIGTGLTVTAGALEADIDMSGFATQTELQQVADSIPSDYVDTTTFSTLQDQVDAAEQDIANIQADYITQADLQAAIPTNVSDFTNDAGYVTYNEAQQTIAALPDNTTIRWNSNNKLETVFTGNYNDLTNKPTIPTVPTDVSDFNNDAGYITSSALTPYATVQYADGLTTGLATESYVDAATASISGGSVVTVTQGLTTGVTVGAIDVDGITTVLYAPAGGGSTAPRYDAGGTIGGAITKEATFTYISDRQIQMNVRGSTFQTGMSSNSAYFFRINISVNSESYPFVFILRTGSTFTWRSNASAAEMSDYSIEGGEQVIQSTETLSGFFRITLKTGYTFADTVVGRSDYIDSQHSVLGYNLNPLFLPIDNQTIKINSDGNIYADVSSGGSVVSITNTLSTGTAIADIDIDGVTTTLYAPSGSGGSTAWADITGKPSIAAGSGSGSIVEGLVSGSEHNIATGNYAHAEGYLTVAQSNYSHAEGIGTIVGIEAQHVQGKYNIATNLVNSMYADVIGNGTSDSNTSNAEATDWNGNKYLAGNIYTNVTDWSDPQSYSIKLANIPECNEDPEAEIDGQEFTYVLKCRKTAREIIDPDTQEPSGAYEYDTEYFWEIQQ